MLIAYARVSMLDQDPALQLAAARARGRNGGRPRALIETGRQAATRVGIASSTLYQHFLGGRSGLGRTV